MSSASWIPRIGSEFAGYRLEELIGHGGMSIVYRAQHLKLERTVALKLLMPELSEDESFRERFMRESRLAAALDHPNVIPIYEAGDQDGVFYIAMRYVGGSTLKALLESEGPLDPERTASIISQVASALNAAHDEKGLVHRDVKPANILIVPGHGADEADHVYLSDFGIAKQRAAGGLTKTGMFVGTADYAAPEQIEGKELDRRADVYALGCVLYECLTGSPTYEKDSEVALMYAHLLEPPPSLTKARPDLPPEIDGVLAKAMAKSRDDRYDTTRDFASDVRKTLVGTATRHTRAAGQPAAAAPEAMLAAQTSAADVPSAPSAAPPPPPVPEPAARGGGWSRGRLLALGGIAAAVIAGGVVAALLLTGGGGKNAATGTLLDVLVPSEVANACTTQKVPAEAAVETDICTPPSNALASFPDNLQLNFYSNGSDVTGAYDFEKSKSKVASNSGRCDRNTWKGEGAWHHPDGKLGGRRVCYVDGNGNAVIAWTHEKRGSDNHADMFAIASEPGRGAQTSLFSWWNPDHQVIGKCRAKLAEQTCVDTIDEVTAK
ncbi:MAG TPA: serine/threonine-protein kinase [Gaiellaceae bacterium]